jgi:N utilization substance protein B
MLNRRHLRIKVFQAIYSYLNGDKNDLGVGEKELIKGIDRIYELFILHISVLTELNQFASRQIDERKLKRLPTEDDLNPNLKFVEHKLLASLFESEDLQKKIEEFKISWIDNQELIKKIFTSIVDSKEYKEFMIAEDNSFDASKDFIIKIYKKFIADNEMLEHVFEEKSIHWADDNYFVCGYITKFLKNYKSKWTAERKIPALFKDIEDDTEFIKVLFRKTLLNNEEFSKLIMTKAKNWEADRIAQVDFIFMKMAVCELTKLPSVPVKVTLNEYIELSKIYSTPKSKMFINGVLDKLIPVLKDSGEMTKTGRGLMS